MKCPACGHTEQRAGVEEVCVITNPNNLERTTIKSTVEVISCNKCYLTLWSIGRGWLDWSDTYLYWDERLERLEVDFRRKPDKNEDDPFNEIKKLGKDKMAQLIKSLSEEQ